MSDPRIGIYGGTFSPPHVGHIRSAFAFLSACSLDRLFLIPAFSPPHKDVGPSDDPKKRLDMLSLAFGPLPFYNDRIIVSDYELRQGGKSYTYLTLEHFSWISKELFLLVGTDSFLSLDKWREPEKIFRLAVIAHIPRPLGGNEKEEVARKTEEYRVKYGARVVEVPFAPVDVSSTEVRRLIREGKDTSAFVPSEVREYIERNGLYRKETP